MWTQSPYGNDRLCFHLVFVVFSFLCGFLLSPCVYGDTSWGESKEPPDPNRYEPSFLPALGGNTDLGFIFGGLGVLAKFDPQYDPYRWRAQLIAVASIKNGPDGVQFPMYALIAKFDFPDLLGGKLRIIPSVSFTKVINAGYYGIGNASDGDVPPPMDGEPVENGRYNQYISSQPKGFVEFRYAVGPQFELDFGLGLQYSITDLYRGSRLQADSESQVSDCEVTPLGIDSHVSLKLAVGAHYDTRNHETAPQKGMYHAFSVRLSPGPMVGTDYLFAGFTGHLRFYYPFLKGRLVAAMRWMGDVIVGDAPFDELSTLGAFKEIGFSGMNGIRGLPEGRFRGKVKILANFELRYMPMAFSLKSHRFKAGLAAFLDTGRVWADLQHCPELDGDGLRPKIGIGGGPRIQWGETMVIRIDVAYSIHTSEASNSPPIAIYMDMNHIF